jgi:hypothetical protein
MTNVVTTALIQAMVATPLSATHKESNSNLATVLKDVHPLLAGECTPTQNGGEDCNWPVSFDGPCGADGTIAVSGDIDGTLDDTFTGFVDASFTIVPTECSVSGSNLTINGDPSISISGQLNVSDSYPTSLNVTETGAISYGPNPSGMCQFNLTFNATWSGSQVACKYSGTACGQSIDTTCLYTGAGGFGLTND